METSPPPVLPEAAHSCLRDVFGHARFRGTQDAVVAQLLAGGHALVVMPTGGGKSICYQLPALLRPGVGVVVSPLVALMQDQVAALEANGVRAAALHSHIDRDTQFAIEQRCRQGELDLLYCAPERLLQERTLALLAQCRVALIAIDEAHCVSQWGHDFRPEYQQLAQLATRFPQVPRIALTATADERTRKDIAHCLQLADGQTFISGFDRPNIHYAIVEKTRPREQLLEFIRMQPSGASGIVYALSRKGVDGLAEWLSQKGLTALPYHAGMSAADRQRH
ncbi:MAG: RecQ family ATP-dependent DNA helicase, partial [Oceanococcaceae bacterium]